MPVRARTSAVLPWSIWPAVPIMMFFISTILILAPLGAQEAGSAAGQINAKTAPQDTDQPEEPTATFKTGVSDVRVDVQVTEGNKLIKDLAKSDFAVADEGQPQSIVSFAHGDEPVTLILLLDISGSMQKSIDEISMEAREALDHLRPGDRVALMVFAKGTAVAQGFSDNLAETARHIGTAVNNWDVGTSTLINSAVIDAAHYMEKHAGPGGRRAILILTDNLSTSYRLTDGQVIRELNKADTVMNAIITGRAIRPLPLAPGKPSNPDFTPANVFELAEQTGGEWVKSENAGDSFKDMIERIRSRYMLAYHEPDASPGTFRHITVTLDDAARKRYPGAELHSRSGYYAE
jgi:VWFA-related protein